MSKQNRKPKPKTPKINKILFAETENKYFFLYHHWYLPLKKRCNKLISFDWRYNLLIYGKKEMNKRFLKIIEKEKPDYVFSWARGDDTELEMLLKIREISPKTKTILFSGDEDTTFETFSRYFILFYDYGLISPNPEKYIPKYNKDGIKNIFPIIGALNTDFFKPINTKKKYDVTFIGASRGKLSKRYEYIKFLKDNGIKIKVFGWGWDKYPKLKEIYGGPLESEELVKVLNQSKISLCFSKDDFGKTEVKGKHFETAACKTFSLTEYSKGYLKYFKQKKEIILFKDKEDLLKKIKYYLKHKKERERIAEVAYKKIIKNYNLDIDLKKLFKVQSKKDFTHKKLPKINKKITSLSKNDLNLSLEKLKNKLKNKDYIILTDRKCKNLPYRKYLQAYSLEKTRKPMSCCNYYVHSKILGDYLYFITKDAFKNLNKENFSSFLNINQFMVTKDYLLNNLQNFKKILNGKKIDFITEKNTAIIALPLIRINKTKIKDYETMKKAFIFYFLYKLFSLKIRKKPALFYYIFALSLEILRGKRFILGALMKILKDKDKKNKLNSYKKK